MSCKGAQIVEMMSVRKIVTEIICDVIVANAGYMHFMRSQGLPLLLKSLQTGAPKKEIKKMFDHIDKRIDFLFCLFQRHNNFLKPLKMIKNI